MRGSVHYCFPKLEGQAAPIDLAVSLEREAKRSGGILPTKKIHTTSNYSLRRRIRQPYLILIAAVSLLLLSTSKRFFPRVERTTQGSVLPSSEHAPGLREHPATSTGLPDGEARVATADMDVPSGHLLGQDPQRDQWGLPSLEYFEQTLPPRLKEGKEALAAWASEFSVVDFQDEEADAHQRAVAQALSNGSRDSLVGMTIVIEDVKSFGSDLIGEHLPPRKLRITEIMDYCRWNLVVNAEDVVTKEEYSVSIQIIDVEKMPLSCRSAFQEVQQAALKEEESTLQACGSIPAELVAPQKGLAVPLYTGKISGLDPIHSVGNLKIYSTVALMERVVGDLRHMRCRAREVEMKARDYIATRLLYILLELEQSGVGHLHLDWNSFRLLKDGSILLGNLGSSASFGDSVSNCTDLASRNLESSVISNIYTRGSFVPQAKTNLWGLGVLLFELYTGNNHSIAQQNALDNMNNVRDVANALPQDKVLSETFTSQLKGAKAPERWAKLILHLLEPQQLHRIGGFQIVREFQDLISSSGN